MSALRSLLFVPGNKNNMLDKALFNMALGLERRKKGSHSHFFFRIASPHPIRPACAKKNTKLLLDDKEDFYSYIIFLIQRARELQQV